MMIGTPPSEPKPLSSMMAGKVPPMTSMPDQMTLDESTVLDALITDRARRPKRRADCYRSRYRHHFPGASGMVVPCSVMYVIMSRSPVMTCCRRRD